MINRNLFFSEIKQNLFTSFRESQVVFINKILDYFESQTLVSDLRQFAYILGTIHHETAATMQPIEEYGKGKGLDYSKRLKFSREPYTDTENIFYGRGYVQSTWYENYQKLTKANNKGWDFFNKPELLLQHEPSLWATFYGMSTGLYTGKKLSDYFNKDKEDWLMARSIVNGRRKGESLPDKAERIAKISKIYYKALTI